MEFRDLKRQYEALKDKIDAALTGVAASGEFIGGQRVRELESELAEYVGVRHSVSCANGTDALVMALSAWGVTGGDAVFVPDFTFFATAEAVACAGATPVFVDVLPDTFNMDAESLEDAVRKVAAAGEYKPKAVIPVDLFGLPADYAAIKKVAESYGLLALEDAAQAFGGGIGDKRAGSFGDAAAVSFFPAKPLGCYGDGGAVFTDDDRTAAVIESLRCHGMGRDKYDNVRIGRNSRLDAVQAAVLLVKLEAFKAYELQSVNRIARRYTRGLSGIVKTPVIPDGYYSSFAQYTVTLESKRLRDALKLALKRRGIPSAVYYRRPLHAQRAFAHLPYDGGCPVAERLCDTALSLPMHPYLTDDEVDAVVCAVRECIEAQG